jgi:hypothetical protein
MSASDSFRQSRKPRRIRKDGWTPERQLRFLDALADTRSVRQAAAFAGMSRESAHRLRNRPECALFAALWGRALAVEAHRTESHTQPLTDRRLTRLLGTHFRRERGDYVQVGAKP